MSGAKKNKKGRVFRATAALGKHTGRILFRARHWLLAGAAILCAAVAGRLIWDRIQPSVVARKDYQVELHEIDITPLPPWIHCDLRAEALRDGSLDPPLTILDEDLLDRLSKAFSLHPWVAEVVSIHKSYPAHIQIELKYRRPSAMVEVPGGLYAVDRHGVLLPSRDFTSLEAGQYLRISGIKSQPLGPVGTAWGDAAVEGAALIAEHCAGVWKELNLKSIRWVAPTEGTATEAYFELVTKNGTAIPWGSSPQRGSTAEPAISAKIDRLRKYIADHGNLDEAARRKDLDLRSVQNVSGSVSR